MDFGPVREAGINCGFYLVVMLVAVVLDQIFPTLTGLTIALVLLPYLLVMGFILLRRTMGAPWFSVGDPVQALLRLVLIWAFLAIVAVIFAYNNGLMLPVSTVGAWNHVGTILEEPLAQELVFRAALLTTLSRTRLADMGRVLGVEVTALAGAVIFSVVQCIVFLAAGFSFSDAVVTGGTALITGAVFGVIYLRTQNVWYGVFLHTLVNFGRWG